MPNVKRGASASATNTPFPKDDYLLAYGLMGGADYLVTGDEDLLTLGDVEGLKIVSRRQGWATRGNSS